MKLYEFTLWLNQDSRELDDWSNALCAAGGDDGTAGLQAGQPFVRFHREASLLEDAIRTASDHVRAAGLHVSRCEIEAHDIATWTSV